MNLTIIIQMFILLVLIMSGYICRKTNLLADNSIPILSKLVLNLGIPATVLVSVKGGSQLGGAKLFIYLSGFMLFNIFCAIIAKLTVKILRLSQDKELYQFMYMFSSIGFMGIPVIKAVLGEAAMIYAILFLIPSNIMMFSYGEYIMNREKTVTWRKFVNPPIIASLAALALCVCNIELPYIVSQPLEYLSNLTTPLAMIIIGVSLYGNNIIKILNNRSIIIFIAVKLILLPLLYCGILSILNIPVILRYVLVLIMAMPIPSNTVIYAGLYKKNIQLASQLSVLSSVLSVITVPIVYSLSLLIVN